MGSCTVQESENPLSSHLLFQESSKSQRNPNEQMERVTSKQKMPLSLHFQMLLTFELNAFIDSNHLKQALQVAIFTNPAWRTDREKAVF